MFNNQDILLRNIATGAIIGYMLYWYFPFPPMIWRAIWVLLSLYVILFKESRWLNIEISVFLFIIFNILHFLISFTWLTPNTFFIGNTLSSLLTISLFVYFGEKGVMNSRYFSIVSIILIIVSILGYYHYQLLLLTNLDRSSDYEVTNNASAGFLMLIPMVFLIKNKLQKWIVLMICIFYLLLGSKRGNILAAFIPILLFISFVLKDNRHSAIKTFLVIVLIVIAGFFVYRWTVNNDYLMHRVEETVEGNSSKRDIIYANIWNKWYDSDNMWNYLFGYGYQGTRLSGGSAHSDWLEILMDYGLLGILLYLIIFIALTRQILRTRNLVLRLIIISATLIWFFKSVYSMGFVSPYFPIMMIPLGTALGQYKLEKSLS